MRKQSKRPSGRSARKNPHAVALGRKGGLKGGRARAAKLSSQELSEQGRKAVMVRWAKVRATEASKNAS